ncbi:MAG: flagellar biosynthesis protein FliQ [Spirochaetaceae bacterium]|jgi:flagellar biosynthetic protein FliQ|nr:flagellar biosynthesis protein FliQ [Spirochaetaceae bacterium]
MGLTDVVNLLQRGVQEILLLVSPIVLSALAVGLVVSILQATTSIQEQTLTFVPKLFVILIMLAFLGAWMFSSLRGYTINLFEMIPAVSR